jgi:geranylgeranyl reductase family protein
MDSCDVLIIGGGPAGSSCAWRLRRSGLLVVVWDRERFPRHKVCAGWITPQLVETLEIDLDAYTRSGRTLQPIRGFRLSRMGDREARIEYDRVVSYGIRRCEFDDYLLRRSDAELRLGGAVRSIARINDGWVINDELHAAVLIGAGGHFCPVARWIGAQVGRSEPIVAAQEIEVELSEDQWRQCTVEAEIPELWFTRDLKGYGWVFRKGRFLNVGLGRQDSRDLGGHMNEFLRFLMARGKIPDLGTAPEGHAYLLYDQAPRPLIAEGVLLVGDAAGLAYPKSGEGIRPGIESGILAAEAVLAARGCYDEDNLRHYEQRVLEHFGRRKPSLGITDILPISLAGALAGRFFATPWLARWIVLDRWFFHRRQPALRVTDTEGTSPTITSAVTSGFPPASQVSANGDQRPGHCTSRT